MTARWIKWLISLFLFLAIILPMIVESYKIGVGIADVTGPIVGVNLMAYANLDQEGTGLHLRTFARSFIIDDGKERFVFVAVECAMIGHDLKLAVIQKLKEKYGEQYTMDNVMISATHTHSSPGGHNLYFLFDAPIGGFKEKTFQALMNGITDSIKRAHNSLVPGRIFLDSGEVSNASINRSPIQYLNNPEHERNRYTHNVDKVMTQLKFIANKGNRPMGVINWFAVHSTSMNNTNKLVSSDNFGYASILFEKTMNGKAMVGKGDFVAAFSSTNAGDISPNTKGPRCEFTGNKCSIDDTCPKGEGQCIASGPGKNMFQSTSIIAHRLFRKSIKIWDKNSSKEVTGPIRLIHHFVRMPGQKAEFFNSTMNKTVEVETCEPALGRRFAAGTTDGPGIDHYQGNASKPLYKLMVDALVNVNEDDIKCHGVKPIVLSTKGNDPILGIPFQPKVVSNHLAIIGDFVLVGVPGEFSTMSGRRMREMISSTVKNITKVKPTVVIAGLCNTYSDYVTTPEEYEVQGYEGASTIYGPHTLTVYLKKYKELAIAALRGEKIESKDFPPNLYSEALKIDFSFLLSLNSESGIGSKLFPDTHENSNGKNFGDCTKQPEEIYYPGDTVSASFVSGDPNNNLMTDSPSSTFLTIEEMLDDKTSVTIATDADWETRFKWTSGFAEITWTIPNSVKPGKYRIGHHGHYRSGYIFVERLPYSGYTEVFEVKKPNLCKRLVTHGACLVFTSI